MDALVRSPCCFICLVLCPLPQPHLHSCGFLYLLQKGCFLGSKGLQSRLLNIDVLSEVLAVPQLLVPIKLQFGVPVLINLLFGL